MPVEQLKGLLVADFTVDNLKGRLLKNREDLDLQIKLAPFGQVRQVLADSRSKAWESKPDFAVIWTLPWFICPAFQRRMNHELVEDEEVMEEIDAFAALLLNIRNKAPHILVPAWSLPTYYRGLGMLNMDQSHGITNLLMRMNLRLIDGLSGADNIRVLDPQPWLQAAGKKAFNAKL